ncbi:unnamed protein product [Protopolystoma xenopodis]|uniref:Uncharacterized protein n=1 Tax=Protopolystoma xenopodis TaxID=117903 RepID=A0A448WYX0_9PLAT|nr:unnamed protein product [Protopolystoma xenopodis]
MEPQLASVTSSLLVPPAGCMRTVSSPACQDRGSSPALPDSSQSYPFAGPRLSRPWAYPLQSAQPAVAGPTVFRARSDGELLAEVSAGVSSDRDSEAGPPGDSPRRPGSRSDSAEALDDEETGPGRPKSLEAGESDEDSREARGAVYENGSACRLVHSGREDLAIDGVGEIRAEMLFNGLPTVLEEFVFW